MILFVGGVCLASFACLVVFSSAVNKTEEEKKNRHVRAGKIY